MLEFVLFDKRPFELFARFVRELGVEAKIGESDPQGEMFELAISEDVDDELLARIEERYDELMDMNRELYYEDNPAAADNYRVASLVLELEGGEQSQAHFDPALIASIVDAIGYEKLREFVQTIVRAVEDPDARTYCQKVRAGEVDFGKDRG
jgi:hypothetical protein